MKAILLLLLLSITSESGTVQAQVRQSAQQQNAPAEVQIAQGWTQQPSGTTAQLNSISFINADTGWIASNPAFQQTGGVIHTTDGGIHWQQWGPSGGYYLVQFLNADTGWISSGQLLRTTNGGTTWDTSTPPLAPHTLLFVNFDTGYVSAGGIVQTTFDGGKTWKIGTTRSGTIAAVVPLTSSHVIAFGQQIDFSENPTAESFDGGITWDTVLHVHMPYSFWGACKVDSLTMLAVGDSLPLIPSADVAGMVRTTNGGKLWSRIPVAQSSYLIALSFANEDTAIGVGYKGLISRSIDGGLTWSKIGVLSGSDSNFNLYRVVFVDQNTVYVIGDGGLILKSTDAGFSWVQPNFQQTQLVVHNYPEPTMTTSTIAYDLPVAQHVSLSVYDIAGRQVKQLLQGVLQNPGTHSEIFDGSNLPTGAYSYQLSSENFTASGKITIIK